MCLVKIILFIFVVVLVRIQAFANCAQFLAGRDITISDANRVCSTLYGGYCSGRVDFKPIATRFDGTTYVEVRCYQKTCPENPPEVEVAMYEGNYDTCGPEGSTSVPGGAPSANGGGGTGGGSAGGGTGGGPGGGSSGPPCENSCCPGSGGTGGGELKAGSQIGVDFQTLGETIPLIGVPLSLMYNTTYSRDRLSSYRVNAVISGNEISPNATGFNLKIYNEINSLIINQNFPAAINQNYTWTWDGNLANGAPAKASVNFRFIITESNSTVGNIPIETILPVGQFRANEIGLGHWYPSLFKYYDHGTNRVYNPDGSIRKVVAKIDSTNSLYRVASIDASEVYEFDLSGRIKFIRTGVTGQVQYQFFYNVDGHLTQIQNAFGKVTSFNRNGLNVWTSITTPYNKTISINTDTNSRLTKVIQPNLDAYEMTYQGSGSLLASFKKPNLATSTFTYDLLGDLTQDAHSGGFVQNLAKLVSSSPVEKKVRYSQSGVLTDEVVTNNLASESRSVLNTLGTSKQVTFKPNEYSYSSEGYSFNSQKQNDLRFGLQAKRIVSQSGGALGATYQSTSFAEGVTLSNVDDPFSITSWTKTDQMGTFQVSHQFDPNLKKWNSTTSLGNTSNYTIDQHERKIQTQVGNLTGTNYTYTGEKLTAILQGTRSTSFTYSPTTGLLTSFTNPSNQTTSYAYDANERIAAITRPDANSINMAYNSVGQLTAIQPVGRPQHIFTFNTSELMASYVPPSLASVPTPQTTFAYQNKKLTTVTRPDGKTISYGYDSNTGKLSTISTIESTTTVAYDPTSLLPSSLTSNQLAHVYLTYSGRVPITQQVYDLTGSRVYSLSPNANGTLFSDTVNTSIANALIYYGYDIDLNMTSAGDATMTYSTPNSLIQTVTTGNQVTTNTYNSFGEVLTQSTKVNTVDAHNLTLTYDGMGRVATKKDTIPSVPTPNYKYTYDLLGRLTVVEDGSTVLATYSYDLNGNRTQKIAGPTATNYTYDDQDRILTAGVFTFAYNAHGEMVSKTNTLLSQTTSYAYDSFGTLVQVTLPNSSVINYGLDTLGRRVSRSVNSILDVQYVYADQVRIVAEINPDQSIKRRYVYGSKSNIPDYYIEGLDKFRVISDQLGTPRIVMNITTGAVIASFDHDEFGNIVANTNSNLKLPFDFAGGLRDWDTGLIHFGAREYDPSTGRWLSKDPILFSAGDPNLYGYVASDPVNAIDPSGLYEVCKRPIEGFENIYPGWNHSYLCANGVCGGLTTNDGTSGAGGGTTDDPGPGSDGVTCKNGPADNQKCMDECIKAQILGPKPSYNITTIGGSNCHSWKDDTIAKCAAKCGK